MLVTGLGLASRAWGQQTVIKAFVEQAQAFVREKKYAQAETLYQQALRDLGTPTTPEEQKLLASIFPGLKAVYFHQGKKEALYALFDQQMVFCNGRLSTGSLGNMSLENAKLAQGLKDLAKAETLYKQAIKYHEKAADDVKLLAGVSALADLYRQQGRTIEAQALGGQMDDLSKRAAAFVLAQQTGSCSPEDRAKDKLKPVDYQPAIAALQKKVKANWHPPKSDKSLSATVMASVDKDGKVSNLRMKKTSGNDAYDAVALATFRDSAPFTMPAGMYCPVSIEFIYDYDVYQKPSSR